jgi:hypothetical protein
VIFALMHVAQVQSAPTVAWHTDADTQWTLALVSPDYFEHGTWQKVHWLVANIRGNDIAGGRVIVPYAKPQPPKGLGYLRYVLVLLRQGAATSVDTNALPDGAIDMMALMQSLSLEPMGFAYAQLAWDSTCPEEPCFDIMQRPPPPGSRDQRMAGRRARMAETAAFKYRSFPKASAQ